MPQEGRVPKPIPPLAKEKAPWGSEERIRAALQTLDVGVAIVGPGTEALLFNEAALELLGLTADQLRGLSAHDPLWDIIHEDGSKFAPDEHPSARAIATRQPVRNVAAGVYRPAKGDRIWLLCNAVPRLGPDGQVTEVVCSFSDINMLKRAEQALQSANESLRRQSQLLDLARDPMIVTDMERSITSWNPGAEKTYGWSKDEAIGKTAHVLLQTRFPVPLKAIERELLQEHFWEGELVQSRRDGTRITVASHWVLQRDDGGRPNDVLEINRDITERKQAEEALVELSARLLNAHDEDRRAWARELHDSTSPSFTALISKLYQLKKRTHPQNDVTDQILDDSTALAESLAREIRTVSSLLYPALLEERGFVAALQWYVDAYAKRAGMVIETDFPERSPRLPTGADIALFRIVQECLSNVLRHLGSRKAAVHLRLDHASLTLEVIHDGPQLTSIALQQIKAGTGELGVGFAGMRERLRPLGGRIEVFSIKSGILVRAVLPLITV